MFRTGSADFSIEQNFLKAAVFSFVQAWLGPIEDAAGCENAMPT
jgi:hypothetical protein